MICEINDFDEFGFIASCEGLVYVMVELCPLGSLENYLREHRVGFVNEFEAEYCNRPTRASYWTTTDFLKTSDLLKWSIQVASAMDYLDKKNVNFV
jgi:hypothetical protein